MRKSHFNDEFLALLGPIISRLFTCSNMEKQKTKTKGACSSPVSMGTDFQLIINQRLAGVKGRAGSVISNGRGTKSCMGRV
jgi:hypothetical protein